MRLLQKQIAIFLLVIMTSMQAIALHGYAHDDDASSCEICIIAQHTQQNYFLVANITQLPASIVIIDVQEAVVYHAFAKADNTPLYYSVRPPPVFTC